MDPIAYLLERCPDLAAVIPGVRTIEELLAVEWGGYSPVKGAVQSGKTRFMIYASLLLRLANMSVVVLLRNLCADREQFGRRMAAARAEWSSRFPDEGSIFVCLTNASACRQLEREVRGTNYALIIDEADACDSFSDGRKKDEFLALLKSGARKTFGVSATVMDLIGQAGVAPSSLILLTPPADYRGFMDLTHVPIETESAYSARTDCDLTTEDPGLDSFVGEFSAIRRPKPCIGLVNICRTKAPCYRAVRDLSPRHPSVLFLVYNGDGIVSRRGRGPFIEIPGTIAEALQEIKDSGSEANILIFSGDLAGRGISFVSTDLGWHLTHERLLVSPGCDEAEILQRLRLLGRYEPCELTLYARPELLRDLRAAYFRQEELVALLRSRSLAERSLAERSLAERSDLAERSCRSILLDAPIQRAKLTKRSMVKDRVCAIPFAKTNRSVGWSAGVYSGSELPPDEFYEMAGRAPPERSRVVFESEEQSETEGEFVLVDPDRMAGGTLKRLLAEETVKQIIDRGRIGTDVSRAELNGWLLEMGKKEFRDADQLNGSWNGISIGMDRCALDHDGLLYRKDGDRYFFRLNM